MTYGTQGQESSWVSGEAGTGSVGGSFSISCPPLSLLLLRTLALHEDLFCFSADLLGEGGHQRLLRPYVTLLPFGESHILTLSHRHSPSATVRVTREQHGGKEPDSCLGGDVLGRKDHLLGAPFTGSTMAT